MMTIRLGAFEVRVEARSLKSEDFNERDTRAWLAGFALYAKAAAKHFGEQGMGVVSSIAAEEAADTWRALEECEENRRR